MEKKTRQKSKLLTALLKLFISIVIIICVVALVSLGIFLYNRKIQEENSRTIDIGILLEKSLTFEQEQNIENQIEKICDTIDIKYISKEDTFKYLKENFEDSVKYYDEDMFSGQYTVTIKLKNSSKIIEELTNLEGVKDVKKLETITYKK